MVTGRGRIPLRLKFKILTEWFLEENLAEGGISAKVQ
jgi:hypothetical protein